MLPRLGGLSGEPGPDLSACSSDTGDVLIRSTRVLSHRRHGPGPGPGPGSVQITVQKLRDPPVQPLNGQRSPGTGQQQRQKPDNIRPLRAAVHSQPDRQILKKPGPTKENREPRGRQPPAAASSPDRKLSAGTQSDQQPGHDLLTSRFAAGGRGLVLAALKPRSAHAHSAPHRREVTVQLLDAGPLQTSSQEAPGLRTSSQEAPGLRTSSQDALGVVQMEVGLPSGCPGDASNAEAAPVFKAQSHMEAQVSQLAAGVQQLLQTDRGRGLSQQTLRHLETLHSQQMQLQSQLLESALRMMTGHAAVIPTTSDLTASGQPARLQVTHLDSADNVLSNQQPSSLATRAAAVETGPVAMATPRRDRWPEQTR